MTLDEAIKDSETISEECQRVVDTGIIFGDVRIDMLYCDNAEEELAKYKQTAENYRQLAEWLKELKQLREQTRWIPVSEKLPEDGQYVLFCDIDDDIMIGYHVKGRPDTHFSQDGTYEDIKNVRAWMPRPKPYKPD